MSTRRATSTKAASTRAASGIQPWHIAVFVVAAVLGLWQLSRMAVTVRQANDVKVGRPAEPLKMPAQASPNTLKVIKDKDADSDN